MSKTKEELNEINAQVEDLKKKLEELTPDELEKVTGGAKVSLVAELGPMVVMDALRASHGPSDLVGNEPSL